MIVRILGEGQFKVDDTATALLMNRFYQNLLGKREGLNKAMPKADHSLWPKPAEVAAIIERAAR